MNNSFICHVYFKPWSRFTQKCKTSVKHKLFFLNTKLNKDLCLFPSQTIQYQSNDAPTSNAEEAELERFYDDLPDLLELIPQKDVLFIIGGKKYLEQRENLALEYKTKQVKG